MDSPNNKAYYLGQGCWECMEDFPQKHAEGSSKKQKGWPYFIE